MIGELVVYCFLPFFLFLFLTHMRCLKVVNASFFFSSWLTYLRCLKVVNDGDMYLWRELGVNSWPTFVLIGPNGKVLAQISGEGHRKVLRISLENIFVYTFLPLHASTLQTIFFGIHFFQESMRTILSLFSKTIRRPWRTWVPPILLTTDVRSARILSTAALKWQWQPGRGKRCRLWWRGGASDGETVRAEGWSIGWLPKKWYGYFKLVEAWWKR